MSDREQKAPKYRPISNMLTTSEVAQILNVHTSTVRRWGKQGKIKPVRISPRGQMRFRREEVAVFYLDKAIRNLLRGR